jgi:micrococcal nuclease
MAYEYPCKILRVVDGDTVDVDIDLGFGVWIHRERVRIMGIDTPESRTRDLTETMMPIGSMQMIKTEKDKTGKFGRVLGDFLFEGKRLTEIMIEENHAVPYFGGSKDETQAAHMANREILLEKGLVTLGEL